VPDTWQKVGNLAIAPTTPYVISPSQRFWVAGSAWLPGSPAADALSKIAQQWEAAGTATWATLLGAFALVIWDRDREMLWLGRDRVGIQTAYFTTNRSTTWIANQLHPLRAYRSNQLDQVALRDYLTCAFVPGDRTLWQDVREVRPGSAVQFPDRQVEAYWTLQEQIQGADQSLDWHGDRVRQLLRQVVQESLPPDEPVGVFLSGGLDSSCVTALAAQLHPQPVHTYSIHFGPNCPNELEFSSQVASHCQTHHHILEIPLRTMWQRLPETMAVLDDPIGDPLTVPNLLLARLAQDTVRVVLNGEGGDPCFGGPKNQPMLMNQLYHPVNAQDTLQAYLISFQKCALELPNLLKPEVWKQVQAADWVFTADLTSQLSYLNRLMVLNIKYKGADHILTKVNNLTRAATISGRSPLFDPRIVDLSMQIPPAYKLSGTQEKAVLKAAVADLLPDNIVHRPKSGMMVPVQLGFREHWNRPAKSLLLSRQAAIAPYLNQTLIRDWLNYRGDTWNRYGVKLWLLSSLEYWLQAQR
jgi:asparagine synthase (glutamine-hydrolysing)